MACHIQKLSYESYIYEDCGLNISIGTFIVIRLIVRLVMMFAVFAVTYVFSSRFSEVRGRAVVY